MEYQQQKARKRQLIVIGNGFDLACGLKSSYADFFSPRLQNADSLSMFKESEWRAKVDEFNLTVWDFILRLGIDGPDWCNLEKVIANWILPPENIAKQVDGHSEKTAIEQLLSILDLPVFEVNPPRIDERTDIVLSKLTSQNELKLRDVVRCVWHKNDYQAGQGMDKSQLLGFFRDELCDLEGQFRGYLLRQGVNGLTYCNTAIALLGDIACDGLPSSWREYYDKLCTTVLSFNYTTPFNLANDYVDQINVANIHGTLKGEIVFGVDGKECMEDLGALAFTKTYRVASMGVNTHKPLYNVGADAIGPSDTDSIKFFGHSLGEADYSYFQSIFDGINLYGGNTRIIFYYRPWPDKDEDDLHAETVKAVTMLLTIYGRTLDNKDHGKNLMHKLLLEGRLEIKRLEKRSW